MRASDCLSVNLTQCIRTARQPGGFFSVGNGWLARATSITNGYRVYCWSDFDKYDSVVETCKRPHTRYQYRTSLCCHGCKAPKNRLYSGKDHCWYCIKCLGLSRNPSKYQRLYTSATEGRNYLSTLQRFSVNRIVQIEIDAIDKMPVVEFFETRGYLIPPVIDRMRQLNPTFYWRSLERLKAAYRQVLRKFAVRELKEISPKNKDWLFRQIEHRIASQLPLTSEEKQWLSLPRSETGSAVAKPKSRKYSRSGASAFSRPLITSSSWRTSSNQAMSAEPATEDAPSSAPIATVRERVEPYPTLAAKVVQGKSE